MKQLIDIDTLSETLAIPNRGLTSSKKYVSHSSCYDFKNRVCVTNASTWYQTTSFLVSPGFGPSPKAW